jgi:hypothetical protein
LLQRIADRLEMRRFDLAATMILEVYYRHLPIFRQIELQ